MNMDVPKILKAVRRSEFLSTTKFMMINLFILMGPLFLFLIYLVYSNSLNNKIGTNEKIFYACYVVYFILVNVIKYLIKRNGMSYRLAEYRVYEDEKFRDLELVFYVLKYRYSSSSSFIQSVDEKLVKGCNVWQVIEETRIQTEIAEFNVNIMGKVFTVRLRFKFSFDDETIRELIDKGKSLSIYVSELDFAEELQDAFAKDSFENFEVAKENILSRINDGLLKFEYDGQFLEDVKVESMSLFLVEPETDKFGFPVD